MSLTYHASEASRGAMGQGETPTYVWQEKSSQRGGKVDEARRRVLQAYQHNDAWE